MDLAIPSTSDNMSVVAITLLVALLCACIVIGHLLEENRWTNESITPLVIGLFTGLVILFTTNWQSSRILVFNEELFFIYLLPPIIFNAGFQVKKKQFFHNFMTIMLFGAAGTLISFLIISLGAIGLIRRLDIGLLGIADYLAIGAIFSATDSVCTLQVLNQDETPLLYSLVFGEGVVNDATSVVLFNAIQNFDLHHIDTATVLHFFSNFFSLFTTSTLLGAFAGLLSAYIIKTLYFGRHSTDREVALMILMAYLSYMLAEFLELSAILTVFFCGIVMSHYTWHNVTESSRVTTKHAFATLSFISEVFLFLYVGMDALDIEKWKVVSGSPRKLIAVSLILLGLVLVGRAAFVFPLSFLSNLTKKTPDERITFKHQVTIWWAGLMRGAVSMALAYNQFTSSGHTQLNGNAIMITSTITVVLFSTMLQPLPIPKSQWPSVWLPLLNTMRVAFFYTSLFEDVLLVFGLMTKPLVRLLLPNTRKHGGSIASQQSSPKALVSPLLGSEQGSDFEAGGQSIPRPTSLKMLLTKPTHTVHYYWRKFDNAVMRPVFGGRGFAAFVPGSPTEQSLHLPQ